MARKSVKLLAATPTEWVDAVLADFDAFLVDHANCERKASALGISLVVKYPDRAQIIPDLIKLAQEELQHFGEAYQFMEKRGIRFYKDSPDPYVNELIALARHGRDDRFIDRMLISSLIETRGAERFGLIAEALEDPELKSFYTKLWNSEIKHAHQFVHLLLREVDEDAVYPRLHELAKFEASIMVGQKIRAALH